ncbi:MAG TPA: sigma-70 family RNA polymerase sigma factor [Anaeromyxobacter sp.]|nr:sigma-70 family RNA polymerase sigma factor [Anaeromyxobacter sp.]
MKHRPDPAGGDDPLAHLDALYRLARHLSRSAADAEDLVQETYARAFRGAAGFTIGTDRRAWLFRILRNAFLDQRRREARMPLEPEPLEGDFPEPAPGDGLLRGDAELEQLRRVVGAEIEAALRGLSEEARMVVLLDVEGLSEAEMAEVMGCAPGTVKSRLYRARAALRERLGEYRR